LKHSPALRTTVHSAPVKPWITPPPGIMLDEFAHIALRTARKPALLPACCGHLITHHLAGATPMIAAGPSRDHLLTQYCTIRTHLGCRLHGIRPLTLLHASSPRCRVTAVHLLRITLRHALTLGSSAPVLPGCLRQHACA
jgi:hypothetical protein